MSGFAKLFIDRPILAAAISAVIVLGGLAAVTALPIAQYPDITPPTVSVSCVYPGASAKVVAEAVAAPVEQQVVGVERMLYMSSQSSNDGTYTLTVTFEVGTDLDAAQVQVQNRVNLALPGLPEEVKKTGVSVKKKSPSILLVVNLYSPDGSKDLLYMSNYAAINVVDELKQVPGVGDVTMFGQQDYSMRVWLDPDRVASRKLTTADVVTALRAQNVQVAAGSVGRPPVPTGLPYQYTLTTLGRLTEPEQFGDVIIKTGEDGQVTRLRDVVSERRAAPDAAGGRRYLGGIELGAKAEDTACTLDGRPSAGVVVYQQPGSNALKTAEAVRARMEALKGNFPKNAAGGKEVYAVDYAVVYDTTPFIEESVKEVFKSLRDAIVLVALVVLLFLQTWRATLIPLIAVPVAVVGTFAVMAAIGFSLNNLTLLGLVLAIGIVVDDAIVVVEAVEHKIAHGLAPREATRADMEEVSGPIVAISLVLMAVFVPCAFITGITGQFFRQFAVTVAVSTFFSAVNSLTLSPALCALLLRPHAAQTDLLSRILNGTLGGFFRVFNRGFDRASNGYAAAIRWVLRLAVVGAVVYVGLLGLTYKAFTSVPTGFVPLQDKGYLVVSIQLPDSASLERTRVVTAEVDRIVRGDPNDRANYPGIPGVAHTISIPGQSILENAIGSNFGAMFVVLDDFQHRHGPGLSADAIAAKVRAECFRRVEGAQVAAFGAPAIDGLGNAGGFKVMVRDRADAGLPALQASAEGMSRGANATPGLVGVFTTLRANAPQYFVDVDRAKCISMGVSLSDVFNTLQVYLGGLYANDINRFGRTWQVNVQADPARRLTPDAVKLLQVRNAAGEMVPLGTVAQVRPVGGPVIVTRYNGVTAATVTGGSAPGVSTGSVIAAVDGAAAALPQGVDYQWTELMKLQLDAGSTALVVFAISVVLVYLLLAAQYESLRLPLAVILVVPMCLLCSVAGVALAKMDINIFVQIGFVVLVGLASKNAILIVEFAKEQRAAGATAADAAVEACRTRLRPILMTSLAFILGVVPLMLAAGAGAEMRRTLGVAVFSGMLGVTAFGLLLTPLFYYGLERLFAAPAPTGGSGPAPAPGHQDRPPPGP
ncbi:MAG: efflux RND transporter permease subunit [Gemmata sp.]